MYRSGCFDYWPKSDLSALAIMVVISVTLHPSGLSPAEAAKAWYLRVKQRWKWCDILDEVVNVKGEPTSEFCVRLAVKRLQNKGRAAIPKSNYQNCGRRYGKDGGKYKITPAQAQKVVQFVKTWRHKRFCTCPHIRRELKLDVSDPTIARTLNRHGFYWRAVPKKTPLKPDHLVARKAFVEKYGHHTPAWWEKQVNLVLDGVTLTKAPPSLTGSQKHAAQSITHVWMKKTEKMDNNVHTHNRYGVQYGVKVPLWGGFTGGGSFALRLWTARAKMDKPEWAQHMKTLKRCLDPHPEISQSVLPHSARIAKRFEREGKGRGDKWAQPRWCSLVRSRQMDGQSGSKSGMTMKPSSSNLRNTAAMAWKW